MLLRKLSRATSIKTLERCNSASAVPPSATSEWMENDPPMRCRKSSRQQGGGRDAATLRGWAAHITDPCFTPASRAARRERWARWGGARRIRRAAVMKAISGAPRFGPDCPAARRRRAIAINPGWKDGMTKKNKNNLSFLLQMMNPQLMTGGFFPPRVESRLSC